VLTFAALAVSLGCQNANSSAPASGDAAAFTIETVAANLRVPWSLAFLPDGRLIYTERPGRVSILDLKGALPATPVPVTGTPEEVAPAGEGGLMGLALHPQFAANHWLYLSLTYSEAARQFRNRVVRYRLDGTHLTDRKVILDALPGAGVHDGCRLRFGPDGKLYVTTGDSAQRELAQQMDSLAGKILRLNDDGSIPGDNPFPNSLIYTFGHRNPQGIDWQPGTKRCYEAEHGPSGFDGPGGGDEVNYIEAGKNYGWPVIHHRQTHEGMVSPIAEWTPATAPSGCSFYTGDKFPAWKGNLFVCFLRGADLQRLVIDAADPGKVVTNTGLFNGRYGRLRDCVTGPDGALYFCTSNQDGRGSPAADDDRILRLVPAPR